MGNCLSNTRADEAGQVLAGTGKSLDVPLPFKAAPKGTAEEIIDLDAVENVVTNPDTDLILNMLDPVNGPASGLPYQVHYLGPPRPPCEKERLATVHALSKINKAAPDPEIATILKLVASVFKAPAALCALFDEKQVFISEQEGNVFPCGEFPWRWTLCGWSMAFKNPQVLVIPDTLQDARFANNLKVTKAPHVRFYCGSPLVASNGQRLGTLCFADVKPRKFDQASCIMMNNMSELVVRQLEKDIALKLKEKDNKMLMDTYKHLQRAVDCFEHCVVLLDTSEQGWKIVYANASWTKQTGMSRDKLVGSTLADVLEGTDGTQLPTIDMLTAVKMTKVAHVKLARVKDPSITKTVGLSFKPAGRHVLDDSTIPIGVPSFLDLEDQQEDVSHRFYFMMVSNPDKKKSSIMSSCLNSPFGLNSSLSVTSSERSSDSVVDGLELAHLLGRGSFGWVYFATWYGTPVAVKVIDEDIRRPVNSDGCRGPLDGPHAEAVMAVELRHPNIVATLKYATHGIPRGRAPDLNDYLGTNNEVLFDSSSTFAIAPTKSGRQAPPGRAITPHRSRQQPCSAVTGHIPSRLSIDEQVTCQENNKAWAVIDAPDDEQWEASISEASETEKADARIHKACQVKADAWVMEEQKPGGSARFGRASLDSSACTSSCANTVSSSMLMQTWMVMEYCDRGCVQDAVDRGWLRDTRDCLLSKPKMDAVIATAFEVASAMQYLHAHDIVHGDLSGWNVLLSSAGAGCSLGGRGWTAKVADFGLSRSMDLQARITTKNYGTITHMPPELLTAGTMSKAVDIYSFGVLLWQMYTGSRPWSGLTHAQIILKVTQQKQQLKWDQDAYTPYRELAQACMAFNMEDRPSFASIVETLEEMKRDADYVS